MVCLIDFQTKFSSVNPEEDTGQVNAHVATSDRPGSSNMKKLRTEPKPPLLYIYGIDNKYDFTKKIQRLCQLPPISTHTKEQSKLQPIYQEDYEKIKAYCLQHTLQFVSEISKRERLVNVVKLT